MKTKQNMQNTRPLPTSQKILNYNLIIPEIKVFKNQSIAKVEESWLARYSLKNEGKLNK